MSDLKSSIGISYVCIAVTRMPDTNYVRRKGGVGSEFQIIPSIVSKKKKKQTKHGGCFHGSSMEWNSSHDRRLAGYLG